MRTGARLILTLYLSSVPFSFSQDFRLPRNPEKLIDRAQTFWTLITSNQRFRALEFVLPEKRDLFLAGRALPILKAKVVGLDVTTNVERGAVRTTVDVLSIESTSGSLTWTITDPWIWKDDNWYLNIENPPDVFPHVAANEEIDIQKAQKQIEKDFHLVRDEIDLGTLLDGQHFNIDVPIEYTGDLPLTIELGLPNPLVALGQLSEPITSRSKNFVLLLGTDNWDGPFTLPLPLTIRYLTAAVERTVRVKGNVFHPVSFRQVPPNGPIEEGREFSVFIRNNTDEEVGVNGIIVDAKLDVLKRPETLPSHVEEEVVLKLRPGQIADQLTLILDAPLRGQDRYIHRFRNVRH